MGGHPRPMDPTMFVAKRHWRDPLNCCATKPKTTKPSTGDLSRLWAKGPANYDYYYYSYYYYYYYYYHYYDY